MKRSLSSLVDVRATRAVLIVAAVVLGVVLAFELGVTSLMADRRQDERVADFNEPKPEVGFGEAVALLQSDVIELDAVVAEGVSNDVLRGGPGLHPDSPAPGLGGNAVVLGHRSRYDGQFGRLDELAPGDVVVAQSRGGPARSYVVEEVGVVSSAEAERRAQREGERLTLITSAGGMLSRDRLVVTAISEDAVAAPGSTGEDVEDEASAATQSVVRLGGTGLRDVLEIVLWLGVLTALLLAFDRIAKPRPLPTMIVLSPLAAFAALHVLLSLESVLPNTA